MKNQKQIKNSTMSTEYGNPDVRRTYKDVNGDEFVLPDALITIANEGASSSGPSVMPEIEFDDVVSPKALSAKPSKKTAKKGAVKRVDDK